MADQKIIIDGDTKGLVAAVERSTAAINRQKAAVQGSTAAAKTMGTELEKTFAGLGKSVLIIGAIRAALDAAAQAAARLRVEGAKIAEKRGGEAVDVERALLATKSNLTAQQRQSLLGMVGEGSTTAEETSGFIEAYAKKQGRRMQFGAAQNAVRAFTSGAFTQEELLSGRGAPTFAEQQQRMAALSPEARAELENRSRMRTDEAATRSASLANTGARFVDEEQKRRELESPVLSAALSAIKAVPLLGGLASEVDANIIARQQNKALQVTIAPEQMARLAPAQKPITGKPGARE